MWPVHAAGFLVPLERNGALAHTTAWANLENILLSDNPNPKGSVLSEFTYGRCSEPADWWREKISDHQGLGRGPGMGFHFGVMGESDTR